MTPQPRTVSEIVQLVDNVARNLAIDAKRQADLARRKSATNPSRATRRLTSANDRLEWALLQRADVAAKLRAAQADQQQRAADLAAGPGDLIVSAAE